MMKIGEAIEQFGLEFERVIKTGESDVGIVWLKVFIGPTGTVKIAKGLD